MKKSIHPKNYRMVAFQDLNNGVVFLTKSTVQTTDTIKYEGKEYPLSKIHISSSSHPYFTGEEKILDIEGRVDKFKAKAEKALKAKEAMISSAVKKSNRYNKKLETKNSESIS